MNIFKLINKWLRLESERNKQEAIARLRNSFSIKHRGNALYIVYTSAREDAAINEIPPFASSEEIMKMLEDTRNCAVEYAYGKNYGERRRKSERKSNEEGEFKSFEEYLHEDD